MSELTIQISRREALITAAAGACVGVCGCKTIQNATSGPPTVDVGTPADYPTPTVSNHFAGSNKLLIVRTADRIYATTAICTHRGCTLEWKDQAIRCPCHGSVFGADGIRTAGPAKAPLVRYAISLSVGRLVVDKMRSFQEGQWDDAGAFVRV